MSQALRSIRRVPLPLALLVAVALVVGAAWSVAMAPLQAHDEVAHVAYVEHLAETGTIPSPTSGTQPFGADEEKALALFGLDALQQNPSARPDWSRTRNLEFRRYEQTIDGTDRGAGEGPNGIAKNPPLYYSAQAVAWRLTPGGFVARLSLMRLVSVLLLASTVVFAWLLASEVFNRTAPRTIAAAVVALVPMAGYLGGVVNPDIATGAAWTALLWLALRTVRLGPSVARVSVMSLVAAAALLIHGRNVVILGALVLALAVAWLANREKPGNIAKGASAATAIVAFAAIVLKLTSSGAGTGAYGGETTLGNTSAFNVRQFLSSIWQFYFPKLSAMEPRLGPGYGYRQFFIEQFFGGSFGSNEIVFTYPTYDLIQVAVAVVLVVFYTVLVANWKTVRGRWPAAVICGGSAALVLLFLHLASYRSLIGGSNDPLITGRYLMPVIGLIGLVTATVVAGIPRRFAPVVAGILVGGLFMASVGGISLALTRFYA